MLQKQARLDLEPDAPQGAAQRLYIGCAGWSVSGPERQRFPAAGSHLERYAAVLPAVEINSSFYRPHRPATYARWRDSVPDAFRFSVKLPRAITHQLRLRNADDALSAFLEEAANLEHKLGCLLVQLPPSLSYDAAAARAFFERLRSLPSAEAVDIACEPRHASWFAEEAAAMFAQLKITRVLADPAIVGDPAPALYQDIVYVRLHGSPVMYCSSYPEEYLAQLTGELHAHRRAGRRVWCIFDNTAEGAAMSNALTVQGRAIELNAI
jgi:uncharacterized protein YecE (DUF72 family)